MRVAVTGARGFVGSFLVPSLERRGHEVLAVARHRLADPAAYEGCAAAIHLANLAHGRGDPAALAEVNVAGSRAAAAAFYAAGGRRFVYMSSVKALGEETRGQPFRAGTPADPRDAYGRAKLEAERALQGLERPAGRDLVILRPPLVYGPGVKANFLALLRAVARGWPLPLGSIRNARSLVYAGNLADAIAACIEAPSAAGAYVVCDGAAVSTPELCRALGRALGRPARLLPFPAALLRALPATRSLACSLEIDDAAFRADFAWRPPFSLETGLAETARWYSLESRP